MAGLHLVIDDYELEGEGLGIFQTVMEESFADADLKGLWLLGNGHDGPPTYDYSRQGRTLTPVGAPVLQNGYAQLTPANHYLIPELTGDSLGGAAKKATLVAWCRSANLASVALGCWDSNQTGHYSIGPRFSATQYQNAAVRQGGTQYRAVSASSDAAYLGMRQIAGRFDAADAVLIHDRPGLAQQVVTDAGPTAWPVATAPFRIGSYDPANATGVTLFGTNMTEIMGAFLLEGHVTNAELTARLASAMAYASGKGWNLFA